MFYPSLGHTRLASAQSAKNSVNSGCCSLRTNRMKRSQRYRQEIDKIDEEFSEASASLVVARYRLKVPMFGTEHHPAAATFIKPRVAPKTARRSLLRAALPSSHMFLRVPEQ